MSRPRLPMKAVSKQDWSASTHLDFLDVKSLLPFCNVYLFVRPPQYFWLVHLLIPVEMLIFLSLFQINWNIKGKIVMLSYWKHMGHISSFFLSCMFDLRMSFELNLWLFCGPSVWQHDLAFVHEPEGFFFKQNHPFGVALWLHTRSTCTRVAERISLESHSRMFVLPSNLHETSVSLFLWQRINRHKPLQLYYQSPKHYNISYENIIQLYCKSGSSAPLCKAPPRTLTCNSAKY